MRVSRWTRLPLALGLLSLACDRSAKVPEGAPAEAPMAAEGSRPQPVEAPRNLLYPSDPLTGTRGAALAPATPVLSGGAPTFFKVKPDLPDGLTLDAQTGTIAGTPTKVTARTTFEITALNFRGSVTAPLSLAVNDAAPGAPEVTLPACVTVDLGTGRAGTKDLGAGSTYAWTLSGGEILSGQGTASITFKGVEEGTLSAQVKVTNSGGSVTGRGECKVVQKPDADFSHPASVRPGEDWMTATAKAQEGATYSWSILPGSSGATLVEGQGTPAIRFASNPALGTFQIQLVVVNPAGDKATSTGAIQVVLY